MENIAFIPTTNQCDEWRKEYTLLLEKEKKAEAYFNDEKIDNKEKEKWIPDYNKITDRLAELLMNIRHYTPDNIIFGWPKLLNPQPKEEKKEIKKEELKTARLF